MKYLLLLTLLFLLGCSQRMNYKDYLVWYESDANPMIKKQIVGNIEYTCTYMCQDYFKARELASGNQVNEKQSDESEYYKINIKIRDTEDPLSYKISNKSEIYERINYLVSDVKDAVLLITSTDTLSCQMHHYERVYHVGNTISVVFIFDKTHEKKEHTIAYNDKLFGNDIVSFIFKQEEINSLPKLK